jgi:cell division control protein 6
MELFKDVLSYEESLFRNEDALNPDFLPEVLPHREDEVKGIADNIKVLFHGRNPSNLFVSGPPSMGKTVSIQYVFNQLGEASDDIIPIYINCWENTTTHAVFVEMAKQMSIPFPSKGVSTEVISQTIFSKLSKKTGAVICFDEMDKSEDLGYLYTIVENVGKKSCIILVTNNRKAILNIDPRVRSRLCLEEMEFKEYSQDEMMDILQERAKVAFVPGVISQKVVESVAETAFERGDLRVGIFLLMRAGRVAEEEASRKVMLSHVKKASDSMVPLSDMKSKKLEGVEKEIYNLIKTNNGKVTGEIYGAYKENGGNLTERSFRLYLKRLERKGIIKTEDTGKGFRGRSRKVRVVGD